MISYSIIITTFNRKHTLQKNLELLANQDYPKSMMEVIVVADGCTDGTEDMVEQFAETSPFPIRLLVLPVEEEKAFRFAHAHNQALAFAQFDYVFFLDDDALCPPNMLREHTRYHFVSFYHHRQEAAVIGATLEGADYRKLLQYKIEDISKADAFYRYCAKIGEDLPGNYFITNNASIKLAYVEGVDGFDETLGYWDGIDTNLGQRIKAKFPSVRFMYAYTSITAHKIIHSDDFRSARDLGDGSVPAEVEKIMKEKSRLYEEILGIKDPYLRNVNTPDF